MLDFFLPTKIRIKHYKLKSFLEPSLSLKYILLS